MRKNKSNSYGEFLRDARWRSGRTFDEITEQFGWSKGTLLMHEKNLSKPTDFGKVIEFAAFLEVDPEDLVSRLIIDRGEAILSVDPGNRKKLSEATSLVMQWYKARKGTARKPAAKKKATGSRGASAKKKTGRR